MSGFKKMSAFQSPRHQADQRLVKARASGLSRGNLATTASSASLAETGDAQTTRSSV